MTLTISPALKVSPRPRKSYARISEVLDLPNLIQIQLDSFRWFQREGLAELLQEISPIKDFTGTRLELTFLNPNQDEADYGRPRYEFQAPKYSEDECRERDMTYASPLHVTVWLCLKETGEVKEQDLFMGDFPLMTPQGTFIINGAERVVVSQLVRSPGVYFTVEEDPSTGRELCFAKLIPNRGAWLEFETSNKDVISVKVDRKRKIPITTLLRAIGFSGDEKLLKLFADVDSHPDHHYIQATTDREPTVRNTEDALIDFYRKLRPGDPPTRENARTLVETLFFNFRRYDLGRVGRYKLSRRLALYQTVAKEVLGEMPQVPLSQALQTLVEELSRQGQSNSSEVDSLLPRLQEGLAESGDEQLKKFAENVEGKRGLITARVLSRDDLVGIVRRIIMVNNGLDHADDIDHLGNRRVRAVGELIQNQFRVGLLRMERVVKERMSICDPQTAAPSTLVNIRPVVAAMKQFFGGSQLSQFMDQTNPLAELTHKRRLSALGPGGLSRERAGFDVRDIHHSHYGRICPIETPEGPNIGLIGSLATYGRINEFGFIETPYRRVYQELSSHSPALVGRVARRDIKDGRGKLLLKQGGVITRQVAARLARLPVMTIVVKPFVSDEIEYLSADREEEADCIIAQANARLDESHHFIDPRVEARQGSRFITASPEQVKFMDVSPKQIVSVSTALIPFLEHDDANRALMGSNMQRQAVPLLRPEAPLTGTGIERQAAHDSGQVVFSAVEGVVTSVSADRVVVRGQDGVEHVHALRKFVRSNQGTCISQRPIVNKGDQVSAGQVLADSSSTENGELALGQSVLCAFMSWEGYNFEDAIVISENLVREDRFTSIHIEKHEVEARETKLGDEEVTRDIPNVGEDSLRDLDETGIIRIGAEVGPGDILVGKITPKGETELTGEEKLLRAIFGEKARDVKDTSLRVPHGEYGKVIDVKVFNRQNHEGLAPGVKQMVRVCVAQRRKISEGDKMAGRHGNKGVVARILPVEDMPFLPDGRSVDIILNPIGVPSRMNLGQVLETHLGWAAKALGFKVTSPIFDGADDIDIEDGLARAWIAARAGAMDWGWRGDEAKFHPAPAKAWLAERGYDGERVFDQSVHGEAKRVCLSLWLEEIGMGNGARSLEEVERLTEQAFRDKGLYPPVFGRTILYDGRTGEHFDQPVTVGYIYMMKLIHLVEDKIHARSTGPYSLITQQPLGGKAQFGGQRFGEMEVWALEAYGAAHNLQELLTVKSDDVLGRVKTYEAVVKGEDTLEPGAPESFKVLIKELQSLGLAVEVLNEDEERVSFATDSTAEVPELGINLAGFEEH